MLTLLRIELFKIFKRPRTYISFVAISAIIVLLQLAMYVDGNSYIEFGMQGISGSFEIDGKLLNGYFVCYLILQTLLIHVPLLIALVAGDMIAGEANSGTLRLLVSKPGSRVQLMLAKFTASWIYTMLLLAWMAVLALIVSLLIFKSGDLMILKSETGELLQEKLLVGQTAGGADVFVNDVLWRYIAALLFAAIAMSVVTALAFMLSVFAENSIGPIIATMAVIIVFTILSTLDIPLFSAIKPWLFTSHMIGWKGFFEYPPGYDTDAYAAAVQSAGFFKKIGMFPAVIKSAGILLLHVFGFLGIAVFVFKKKDILS
jgi:ABC-2 type transport system permease protein